MYALIKDNNRPFALVENNTNMRIEKAIVEEYLYEEVVLTGEIILPDWGEINTINYVAVGDDGFKYHDSIEIMQLLIY